MLNQQYYAKSTIVWPPDKSALLNINFLISQPKHMVWVLKRTVSMKHIFKLMGKEINAILGAQTILIWTCVKQFPCLDLIMQSIQFLTDLGRSIKIMQTIVKKKPVLFMAFNGFQALFKKTLALFSRSFQACVNLVGIE